MEIIKPYITENIKKYGEQSILESLGSFPKQRQMSDKITEKLFDKVYGIHQDTFFVGLEEFGDPNIKIAEITWERGNGQTEAFLKNLTKDGKIMIQVNISLFDLRGISKEMFFEKISYIIAHELMHSNIYYKRLANDQDIHDTPKYYNNAIVMDRNCDDLLFKYFAYAMYNTFYQERQAMISQTETLIFNQLNREDVKNNKNINKIISDLVKESDAYEIYSFNIKVCQELKDNTERKENLKKELEKYFIKIYDIDKLIDKIDSISKETINRIFKNSMLYFEKNS